MARGRGYGLFLTPTETVLVLAPGDRRAVLARRPGPTVAESAEPSVVRMRLIGADAKALITGLSPLPGRSHYFVGEASRWRRDVPTFARVHYAEVDPGVNLVFYGNERELEYDFVVAPGADPGVVELAFDGADRAAARCGRGPRDRDRGRRACGCGARSSTRRTAAGRQPVEGGYVLDGGRVALPLARLDASPPARHRPGARLLDVPRRQRRNDQGSASPWTRPATPTSPARPSRPTSRVARRRRRRRAQRRPTCS